MNKHPMIAALIPARSGSKRVPDKNIRLLAGHPTMAYTIRAALQSSVFADVIVSTDSGEYAAIARRYGAEVPFLRPPELSGDLSPDIEWVEFTLDRLRTTGRTYEAFSILRPTSPFRMPETIQRAWRQFQPREDVDSLRAVEKCRQHPGKMWVVRGQRMTPLLEPEDQTRLSGSGATRAPWHSSPYQALPEVYVQNASLEMAWSRVVFEEGTIAGRVVMPFFTQGFEGFDVNHERDWTLAEELVREGKAVLPSIPEG